LATETELAAPGHARIPAKVGLKRDAIWTVSGAHLVNDMMTVGIVPALLPLYKAAFHLSYTQSGLIILVSYITSSVMQPLIGLITDRRPFVWFLPLGVMTSSAALAFTGVVPSFGWLLLLISISGLGSGLFHPEASRVAVMAAGSRRGLAQAIFQVGGNGGQALGPLMVQLFILSAGLHRLIWLLVLSLAALLFTWRILPWYRQSLRDNHARKRSAQGRNRIGAVSLLVGFVLVRSWVQIGVAGFLPFFYMHHHISLSHAELFDFLFLAAGAIGTFLGGVSSDRLGSKWILVISMGMAIPFGLFLPYTNGVMSVVVLILFGFFTLSSFAVTVVYAQRLLPRNLSLAAGLMIGFGVGAGGIGATLMGHIADIYGVSTVFQYLVYLPILAFLLTWWMPGERKMAGN